MDPDAAGDADDDTDGKAPSAAALEMARRLAAHEAGVDPGHARAVRTLSRTWIAIAGDVVVKVHGPQTSLRDLTARLALAAHPALNAYLVTPIMLRPVALEPVPAGFWATVWPRVDPLTPDVDAAPWREAGALLGGLHRASQRTSGPLTGGKAPAHGSVARLRSALARLAAVSAGGRLPHELAPAADAVQAAASGLPSAAWRAEGGPGRPVTIVHGDWHLGQLGRLRNDGTWRLIDMDDLGAGDPAWDLGRPAAFWAAGLLPDGDWAAFVDGYRTAGGPAVPPAPADPWPAIDTVARACVVLAAAGAVRRAALRGGMLADADARMVDICANLRRQ